MLEVLRMSEVIPIQGTQPIHEITSDEKVFTEVLRNNVEDVQLRYDKAEEMTVEELQQAVAQMNEHVLGVNAQFEYRIHEGTDRIMVKLVDTESRSVIREIPPEKMLDMVAEIWKQVGLVVDKLE